MRCESEWLERYSVRVVVAHDRVSHSQTQQEHNPYTQSFLFYSSTNFVIGKLRHKRANTHSTKPQHNRDTRTHCAGAIR